MCSTPKDFEKRAGQAAQPKVQKREEDGQTANRIPAVIRERAGISTAKVAGLQSLRGHSELDQNDIINLLIVESSGDPDGKPIHCCQTERLRHADRQTGPSRAGGRWRLGWHHRPARATTVVLAFSHKRSFRESRLISRNLNGRTHAQLTIGAGRR
jgi:hypothetical protein